MTIGAFRGREIVKDNRFIANQSGLRVALIAEKIGMAPCQGKRGKFVVIERRRHPSLRAMAVPALGLVVLRELSAMNIGVTILANLRRSLEFCFARPGGN